MSDHTHDFIHKGDPSLDRLVFFSDGVFAIAITLLSIELHPPHDWNGSVADLWARGWPGFMAYGLSFIVVGVFWNAHRRIFSQIRRFTQGVFLLNLLFLGAIALMPFVTSLLYSPPSPNESFMIYLGLVSVTGLFQGLLLAWAAYVSRTMTGNVHPMQRLSGILSAALLPGLISSASLLAFGVLGGGVPAILPVLLGGAAALIIALRVWAGRRFAS